MHTHGTEDGPGLTCPERLVGECILREHIDSKGKSLCAQAFRNLEQRLAEVEREREEGLEVIRELRRKLALAGVEGSPPPGQDTTIGILTSRAHAAEQRARGLEDDLVRVVSESQRWEIAHADMTLQAREALTCTATLQATVATLAGAVLGHWRDYREDRCRYCGAPAYVAADGWTASHTPACPVRVAERHAT